DVDRVGGIAALRSHGSEQGRAGTAARTDDRRCRLLVSAPGQRLDRAALRLRQRHVRRVHAVAADAAALCRPRAAELLKETTRMKRYWSSVLAIAAVAGATLAAQNVQINGAGATFPAPIYTKWFSEYNKLHSGVQINYQALGSGAGIRQITARALFFGAGVELMTSEHLQAAPGKLLHFPTVLGAVVPI